MSNVVHLPSRPAPDVTEQLLPSLINIVSLLPSRARADLLAFVHLVEDHSDVGVELDIADDGTIKICLTGRG